jgi:membrane-associated protein
MFVSVTTLQRELNACNLALQIPSMNLGTAPFLQTSLLFIDAEWLVSNGGMWLVILLIYSTTGLFFCFFLPSGAVLFVAGVMIASGGLPYPFFTACSLMILASTAGGVTGYWFGRKTGPLLYSRNDSRFFRKVHLKTAESFYKKYGWLALTAGLYLPIIRTFAPIVAGIVRMNFRRFFLLTIVGSTAWILSFVAAGYFIASRPILKPWLKYIVIAFVLVVTIPLVIRTVKELKQLQKKNEGKDFRND